MLSKEIRRRFSSADLAFSARFCNSDSADCSDFGSASDSDSAGYSDSCYS